MSVGKYCSRSNVTDALRFTKIRRVVFGIITVRAHLTLYPLGVFWKQVHHSAIGGERNSDPLVVFGPLARRTSKLAAKSSADRHIVIRRPRVVHTVNDDHQ